MCAHERARTHVVTRVTLLLRAGKGGPDAVDPRCSAYVALHCSAMRIWHYPAMRYGTTLNAPASTPRLRSAYVALLLSDFLRFADSARHTPVVPVATKLSKDSMHSCIARIAAIRAARLRNHQSRTCSVRMLHVSRCQASREPS